MAGLSGTSVGITSPSIAVMDISGQIFDSKSAIEKLNEYKDNPLVEGVIIRVDSPGGAVNPSMEIYNHILTLGKPVYAAMGSVAASGGYLIALGFSAYNIILLRNYFSSVPYEIEEAATIDGANEFQLLTRIYLPMSKASIATVTMFYALNHWNSYAWPRLLLSGEYQPLQVMMRDYIQNQLQADGAANLPAAPFSIQSAMIICSIIPIVVVYPQLQKYFAAGVNVGGVKE